MSDPHDPMDGVERRLVELYRGADAEQPSAEIDRRILRAARDAAARRRRRWPLAGLATAAATVLAVALLVRLVPEPVPEPETVRVADGASPSQAAESAREPAPAPAPAGDAALARLAGSVRPVPTAAAPAAAASYAAPGCREPHPLPAGAVIRASADGIEVADHDGNVRFTLRCLDGRWEREPAASPADAVSP